ncbi:MAG: hypothetical protein A3E78_03725 [Alphaproteobacteria bacterium RIFCSPHIGHO2_12_FULL_63_12]|nr:MAG: hypothetical protein A3E78_03725 [Alphaproteobacteria bacterium RIFCSPHIGHO2_12_FULL_63_12]
MNDKVTPRAVAAQSLPGEEDLRFIRNFHDVFLSIGIAMFAAGIAITTAMLLAPMVKEAAEADAEAFQRILTLVAGAAAFDAVLMWLMAEFFARGRRLFLPSIVILIAFNLFFFIAAGAGYAAVIGLDEAFFERLDGAGLSGAIREASEFFIVVLGLTTAAILAFYARMKLPFAMGVFGYSLASVGVAAAFRAWPEHAEQIIQPAQLAAGVFIFLLGVYFDARDPERQTRISDNGFWLHFFAAPLILNSVLGMTVGADMLTQNSSGAALVTLIVVFAFAFVSLLINRRALLVAGLLYALIAAGYLISKVGLSGGWTAAVTLLVMGGAMVLLGGGWHALRRVVVAPFPKTGPIARIIPPEPSKADRRRVSE